VGEHLRFSPQSKCVNTSLGSVVHHTSPLPITCGVRERSNTSPARRTTMTSSRMGSLACSAEKSTRRLAAGGCFIRQRTTKHRNEHLEELNAVCVVKARFGEPTAPRSSISTSSAPAAAPLLRRSASWSSGAPTDELARLWRSDAARALASGPWGGRAQALAPSFGRSGSQDRSTGA
jgi:hypothetical protein